MAFTALVPLANGVEEIEAISIIDTLRRAGVVVTVASVMKSLQITASRGVVVVADTLITTCEHTSFDLIALPGGMPGSVHLRDSEILTSLLKAHVAEGHLYGAICAAPVVVLQYHGLLDTQKTTAHPAHADALTEQCAVSQRVVVDGMCVTSRGPGTALEFALTLVAVLCGTDTAHTIADALVVPWENNMKESLFTLEMTVRDYECDLQGIVNNAVYQNYLEHARHRYLKKIGIDFADVTARGIHLVVTRTELDYRASLKSGDVFSVSVRMEQVSKVRFAFIQEIRIVASTKKILDARVIGTALNERKRPFMFPELVAVMTELA